MILRITAVLILGLITICSNPKNTEIITQNTTELLIQKSPWTFDSYHVLKILDKGNAEVNKALLKFWVYNNSDSVKITFKDHHTGVYVDSKRNQEVTFNWRLIENDIEIKLDIPNTSPLNYKNIEVTGTQFKFEKDDFWFDKEKNMVTFYGDYIYK